ncbi:MAG TPA: metallophosphoesterase [Candidatus Thermoplasmatota archaeon]|nr:metallophosphoesterase [Candidatus Thermoplasmatota archaeon]
MTDATATAAPTREKPTTSSFLPRVALVFTGWTTLHLAVVAALLHGLAPGGWWPFVAIYAYLLLAIVLLIRSFRPDAYPTKATRLFVMRPFWYAQIVLLPASLAGAFGFVLGLPFHAPLAAGRTGALLAGAAALLLIVVGYVGSKALVVRRLTFTFADLPEAFDGVRIAQLSDLHVGPHTSARFLRRIVRAVEREKPDLVAHTGDQVDDYDVDVARFAAFFGPLRAPLGVYAIAGNHDVYAGWPGVRDGMQAAGMRVLVNEATPIERQGARLWIAGTGDPAGLRTFGDAQPEVAPDIPKTLADVPPGAFVLALAHNPALWPALQARGVHLTLSGHTHHGQLSVPWLKWSLASPFLELAMGSYQRDASSLYIHPGTNYWAVPLRVGAWPEVAIVTLRRATQA